MRRITDWQRRQMADAEDEVERVYASLAASFEDGWVPRNRGLEAFSGSATRFDSALKRMTKDGRVTRGPHGSFACDGAPSEPAPEPQPEPARQVLSRVDLRRRQVEIEEEIAALRAEDREIERHLADA